MDEYIARISAEIRERARGISFLSEVDLEPSSLNYVREHISEILDIKPSSDDECIVVAFALVDIGSRFYQDNAYWPFVIQEYNETRAVAGHRLYDLAQSQKNRYLESYDVGIRALGLRTGHTTPRNIEKILIHTFVPDYKMDDFFGFVLLFYRRILGNSLEDLDDGLHLLTSYLQDFVKNEPREVDEDAVPNPQKLLRCTRYALCDEVLSIPFMKKLVQIIDAKYQSIPVVEEGSSRFVRAFEDWFDKYMRKRGRKAIRGEYQKRPVLRISSGNVLIHIPQRKCSSTDRLMIVKGDEIINVQQPNIFSFSNAHFMRDHTVNLSALGISPFDKFKLVMGERTIYEGRWKLDYIIFEDEGFETTSFSEGYHQILFKNDVDAGPQDSIVGRDGKLITILVQTRDVIQIGERTYLVEDPDHSENAIGLSYCRNVVVKKEDQIFKVVSGNRALFDVTVPDDSLLVVRLYGFDGKAKPIRVDKQLRNYYRNEGKCKFELNLSEFFTQPDFVTIDVREHDSRSICESSFVYLPGFNAIFDKKQYISERIGTLTVCDNDPLQFDTGSEVIRVIQSIQGEAVDLEVAVPSVNISFDGERWIGPDDHTISVLKPNWDNIFIKAGTQKKIQLYTDVQKVKLESIETSEATVVNLMELQSEIEKNVYSRNQYYTIFISIDSNPRCSLLRIAVHNGYELDEKCPSIIFTDIAGIPAKYVLSQGGKNIVDAPLSPGRNEIVTGGTKRITLTVYEQNPYSGEYDVEMLRQILGGDEYIQEEDKGFTFVFKNHEMHFDADSSNWSEVELEYGIKERYNPWMKGDAKRFLRNQLCPAQMTSKSKLGRKRP